MKPIWRWIKISTFAGMVFALTGCEQANTARQWWRVWRSSSSPSPSINSPSAQKVEINLQEIARRHPAWKVAQQLENPSPANLPLQWQKPAAFETTSLNPAKSTFTASNSAMALRHFSEPQQTLTASRMENLNAQMSREEQAAWDQWKKEMQDNLQKDRDQIARAMRVDLKDQIDQTQENIPEIDSPLTPSAAIQSEMINLRLKLASITLSPAEKEATQKRLDELNAQWAQQLLQQAQENAAQQQYWRETVPRQMQEKGDAAIAQTLQALQQKDQQAIDLTLQTGRQWLDQDTAQNPLYALTSPAVEAEISATQRTFHAPVMTVKSMRKKALSFGLPQGADLRLAGASQSEVRQLKEVALNAAKRAATQSALHHHWQWTPAESKNPSPLPDVTKIVLEETNFP